MAHLFEFDVQRTKLLIIVPALTLLIGASSGGWPTQPTPKPGSGDGSNPPSGSGVCLGRTEDKCLSSLKEAIRSALARGQRTISVYPGGNLTTDGAEIISSISLVSTSGERPVFDGSPISIQGGKITPSVTIEGVDFRTCIRVSNANLSIQQSLIDLSNANGSGCSGPGVQVQYGKLDATQLDLLGAGGSVGIRLGKRVTANLVDLNLAQFETGIEFQGDALGVAGLSKLSSVKVGIREMAPPPFPTSAPSSVSLKSVQIKGAAGAEKGLQIDLGVRGNTAAEGIVISGFDTGIEANAPIAIRNNSRIGGNITAVQLSSSMETNGNSAPGYTYVIENSALMASQYSVYIASNLPDLSLSSVKWNGAVRIDGAIGHCDLGGALLPRSEVSKFKRACPTAWFNSGFAGKGIADVAGITGSIDASDAVRATPVRPSPVPIPKP